MYSRPGEYRKILLANYLCIGFVPGGIFCSCAGKGGGVRGKWRVGRAGLLKTKTPGFNISSAAHAHK